ncbi:MAG: hypothetical protein ACRCT1_15475 [Microcoleaceae cyanobacterium]
MPAANVTARNLPATPLINLSSFLTAFKTSMVDAGFSSSPFDQFTLSGDTYLVYQIINDANKTLGTVYLQLQFINNTSNNTIQIRHQLLSGFSISTHTGTATTSSCTSPTFTFGNSFQFYAINHPEIKGIHLAQGTTTVAPVFVLRPTYKDTWWDENISPWAFIFYSNAMTSLAGFSNSYYPSNQAYDTPSLMSLSNENNAAFTRSVWPMGLVIFSGGGGGIPGYFQDLRQAAAYNLSVFSRIESPNQSWLVLTPGNGGLVLLSNSMNVIM